MLLRRALPLVARRANIARAAGSYAFPAAGHPPQTDLLTSSAKLTDACSAEWVHVRGDAVG